MKRTLIRTLSLAVMVGMTTVWANAVRAKDLSPEGAKWKAGHGFGENLGMGAVPGASVVEAGLSEGGKTILGLLSASQGRAPMAADMPAPAVTGNASVYDQVLPPGSIVIKKENWLTRLFGRSPRWKVVSQDNASQALIPFIGKQVIIVAVFDVDERVPAVIETIYAYTTFKSVYNPNGSHRLEPPIVGAWYEYHHNPPMVFKFEKKPARWRGDRRTFEDERGRTYSAYAHSTSAYISGVLTSASDGLVHLDIGNGKRYVLKMRQNPPIKLLISERR